MPNFLPGGTGLAGGLAVKDQLFSAARKLHVGARFLQQSREIERGSATADDDHISSAERLDFTMTGAMGKKFVGQMREIFGNVVEMRDPYCKHDVADVEGFAVFKVQPEAARQPFHTGDEPLFQFRHHAVAESQSVGYECVDFYGHAGMGVFDTAPGAELFERKGALGIVNIRGEAVRLKHHAFWHVRQPAIHGAAENAEGNAAMAEMRGNRKPIGACADDGSIQHGSRKTFLVGGEKYLWQNPNY